MDLKLNGKRAFVSGASSGIGKGIAIELAKEGCNVVVHGRDKGRAEETAHLVEGYGVNAVVAIGDLARNEGCDAVAAMALAGLGSIEIVVNNAGIPLHMDNPRWSALTAEDYIDSLQVNMLSTFRMTQHFLPCIKVANWGRIINVSSAAARMAGLLSDYGAAKAALNKLTMDMAMEVGDYGATANIIYPGFVKTTAMLEYLNDAAARMNWEGDQAELERRYFTELAPQSVKRMGTPEDIARAVAFLAGETGSYISGIIFNLDGGKALQ